MKHYFKIAEQTIVLNGVIDDECLNSLSAYKTDLPDLNNVINVSYNQTTEKLSFPDGKIIKNNNYKYWVTNGNEKHICIYNEKDDFCYLLVSTADNWKNTTITSCCTARNINYAVQCFNCIGEVFAQYMVQKDAVVFHCSSILYNNYSIAFSAPSGTGKSTHTGLWVKEFPETVILNDDSPVIKLIDGVPVLFGTPWAGTSGVNTNSCAPLKSVVFLKQAKDNIIDKIPFTEAFPAFVKGTKKLVFPDSTEKSVDIICKLIEKIPVYSLGCNISSGAVHLVENTIF